MSDANTEALSSGAANTPVDTGSAGDDAPDDDLIAAITAAVEEDKGADEASTDPHWKDQPRDKGKWTKEQQEQADAAAADGTDPAAAVADPAAKVDPNAAPVEAVKWDSWGKDWADKFGKIAPEQQKIVADSHREIEQHFAKEIAERDDTLQRADSYIQAIKPFAEVVRNAGQYLERRSNELNIPPAQIFENFAKADATMAYGKIEHAEAVAVQMLKDYGLSHLLAGSQPRREDDQFADPFEQRDQRGQDGRQQTLDPRAERELMNARKEAANLKYQLSQIERQKTGYERAESDRSFASAWDSFAGEKGADGQPIRPFANELKLTVNAILASGKTEDPSEAYRIAEKPIRDRMMAYQPKAAPKPALNQQKIAESVAKAKKAAPVQVSGMSRSGSRANDDITSIVRDLVN